VSTFELNRKGCAAGCGVSTFELNREGIAAGRVSTYELTREGCAAGRVVLTFELNREGSAAGRVVKKKKLLCYIITNTWDINEVNYIGDAMVRVLYIGGLIPDCT
jgi:hypothetical protein